jgi:hypothetical protein
MWATKFRTHTEQQTNYSSVYFSVYNFWVAKWKTNNSKFYSGRN